MTIARSRIRPPFKDKHFWFLQALLLLIVVSHYLADMNGLLRTSPFPASLTVGFLLIPISYAAVVYGLRGSIGTAIWSFILWLPDLVLPDDKGQPYADLAEFVLVFAVAIFVGYRLDEEKRARKRAEEAENLHQSLSKQYQNLFNANSSPVLLVDTNNKVYELNEAAKQLSENSKVGVRLDELGITSLAQKEFAVGNRIFSLLSTPIGSHAENSNSFQLVLSDITEEFQKSKDAQIYAREVLRIQEDERRRLSQEIHDEPVQDLINLMQRLDKLTKTPKPDQFISELSDLRLRAQMIMSNLRNLAHALRPPILDDIGFLNAVRSLLDDVPETVNITFSANLEVMHLSEELELGIFRIFQEGIRNIIRHSQATGIEITIELETNQINLEIKDNGHGFDKEKTHSGLGIMGMKERSELLGGTFEINSTESGTIISISIPLAAHLPIAT